jgi:hypothetical protein
LGVFLVTAVLELGGFRPQIDFHPRGFVNLAEHSQSASVYSAHDSVPQPAIKSSVKGHLALSSSHFIAALKSHVSQLPSALKTVLPFHNVPAPTDSGMASAAKPFNHMEGTAGNQLNSGSVGNNPENGIRSFTNSHRIAPSADHQHLSHHESTSKKSLEPIHHTPPTPTKPSVGPAVSKQVATAKSLGSSALRKTAAALQKPPVFRSLASESDADTAEQDSDVEHSSTAKAHASGGGDDDSALIPDKLTKELSHVIR